tara:strand:- start:10046 stop:10207 length:162 start_codon:yes stop_codon:yes gene_type:complete
VAVFVALTSGRAGTTPMAANARPDIRKPGLLTDLFEEILVRKTRLVHTNRSWG